MLKPAPRQDPFLLQALREAKKSLRKNEVPVGVVIVRAGQIIARGHNLKEKNQDVTGHAEIIALRKAAKKLGTWRLTDCLLYSTLEPCPMCAGAILHARIKKVIYGALDLKWGAAGSRVDLFQPQLFNHRTETSYQPEPACAQLLKSFFTNLRDKKKHNHKH